MIGGQPFDPLIHAGNKRFHCEKPKTINHLQWRARKFIDFSGVPHIF